MENLINVLEKGDEKEVETFIEEHKWEINNVHVNPRNGVEFLPADEIVRYGFIRLLEYDHIDKIRDNAYPSLITSAVNTNDVDAISYFRRERWFRTIGRPRDFMKLLSVKALTQLDDLAFKMVLHESFYTHYDLKYDMYGMFYFAAWASPGTGKLDALTRITEYFESPQRSPLDFVSGKAWYINSVYRKRLFIELDKLPEENLKILFNRLEKEYMRDESKLTTFLENIIKAYYNDLTSFIMRRYPEIYDPVEKLQGLLGEHRSIYNRNSMNEMIRVLINHPKFKYTSNLLGLVLNEITPEEYFDKDIVAKLIYENPYLHDEDVYPYPFGIAITNISFVDEFINSHFDINIPLDDRDNTALHIICMDVPESHVEFKPLLKAIRKLVENGADFNKHNNVGETPLLTGLRSFIENHEEDDDEIQQKTGKIDIYDFKDDENISFTGEIVTVTDYAHGLLDVFLDYAGFDTYSEFEPDEDFDIFADLSSDAETFTLDELYPQVQKRFDEYRSAVSRQLEDIFPKDIINEMLRS